MSKFAKAFGDKYEKNKLSIVTRTFELGNHTFKVRVPSVGELEAIYKYADNPDTNKIEAVYQEMTVNLKGDEVEKTDDDVLVAGRSMREAAKNKVVFEYRVTEYFKLLIPETYETLDDLTYEDIDAEFPLSIQMQFIDRISEVISPEYKEARGKS